MKKRNLLSVLLAVLLAVSLAPSALAAVPDRPENRYVLDSAGVLEEDTERRIVEKNRELFNECGAEIVVAAVDFLGGESIEDYTYKMFNDWGVGSSERNNGLLLVLAIGEEDYFVQAGYGIDDYFDARLLKEILSDYLEPDFAAEDYDAGVRAVFDALLAEMESYYSSGPGADDPQPGAGDYEDDGWNEDQGFNGGLFRSLKWIAISIVRVIVVVALLLFVFSLFRGRGGGGPGPGGGGGGGFWRGMLLGSMMNRRRSYWRPPPPPPGGFGGFPPPPRGGFGGNRGGFGGFGGGGGSRGGGAGRGGFGGGGFHGGGGSHGGGAGRH